MTDLAMILGLINYVFVLFFGVVVSLYLADINFMDHKVLAQQRVFSIFLWENPCFTNAIHCSYMFH